MSNACINCNKNNDGEFGEFHFGINSNLISNDERKNGYEIRTTKDSLCILKEEKAFVCNDCINSSIKNIRKALIPASLIGAIIIGLIIILLSGQFGTSIPKIINIIILLLLPVFSIITLALLISLLKTFGEDFRKKVADSIVIGIDAKKNIQKEPLGYKYWDRFKFENIKQDEETRKIREL